MTEAELRALVVDMAHKAGWHVFSLPIAKTRRPVKDAVGYPDLTLARYGAVRFIELKTEAGNLSPDQMEWLYHLPQMLVVRPSNVGDLTTFLA